MKKEADKDEDSQGRHREILETAARLICKGGYEATSMQQIAEACRLTKPGLYHYVENKEALLLAIMDYGMDLFEERVLGKVSSIADPVERLRACMVHNIELVTQGSSKEVTIILHEDLTQRGAAHKQITARKKRYVKFLEAAFREAAEQGRTRAVNPTLAAFSFLGTVLWTYKWYRPDGALKPARLAEGMVDLFFNGLVLPS